MMAKTIMVSDEVYALLVKAKLPGESFSDVIRRLLKGGRSLSSIAGSKTISKREWLEVVKAFERQRELDEDRRRFLLEMVKP